MPAGRLPARSTQLVQDDVAGDVEWRLGTARAARDGTGLAYEKLLVATAARRG